MSLSKHIVNIYDVAIVKEDGITKQRSLHAGKDFKSEEVITLFSAERELLTPTYLTVQKSDHLHITLLPSFLQYVNHSCYPSAFFNTGSMEFVVLRNIKAGDELTFFYPSTEWEMAQPFVCRCRALNCLGTIQGAALLPAKVLNNYRLTDYILSKLMEQKKERA